MKIRTMGRWTLLATLTAWIGAATTLGAAPPRGKPAGLDFTKGAKPGEARDFNLGPTGARGWMWAWRNHTTDARQILVTTVEKGSPADGVLAVGDVILGAGGKRFDADARVQLGRAITQAETAEKKGLLRLIRWRPDGAGGKKGKTETVTVKLKVMGTYSPTAPYECAKSKAIFERACKAIAADGLDRVSIPTDLNALALLASGNKEYRPMLAAYAKKVAKALEAPLWWWHYGYGHMFLTEYSLATKDPAIRPALRSITMEIVRFQSPVGTWGHEHKLTNGLLHGYGAMNQMGLILTIPLTLARKAGVKDPALDRAIAKSAAFMRWYVDKGSLPYGDHKPWMDHEDNGKNSMGAILYDMLGDGKAATYFAKMSTAAHSERENGHTGNFFNVTWALLGVSRAGPNATGAYMAEQAWYYDLARRWNGRFVHTGIPGQKGDSYRNWDCTGAYALAYGLPRKSLQLTGKTPSIVDPLTPAEATSIIDDGRNFTFWDAETSYDHMTDEQLFTRLTSWSPIVRVRAARSLSHHKGDYNARLGKMLHSRDANTAYGAAEAVAYLGPRANKATIKRLSIQLRTKDPWLLTLTVNALATQDEATRKAVTPDMLKYAVRKLPRDPRRMGQRAIADFLFGRPRGGPKGVFAESLDYDDQPSLVAAVASILANEDGRTRGILTAVCTSLQSDEAKLAAYMPAILEATRESAPSGIMFADGIRMAGLDLMSRQRIREGMALCVAQMEPDRWGNRMPRCLASLKRYGGNAKPLLGELRKVREQMARRRGSADSKATILAAFDETIKAIETDKNPPKLRSIADLRPGGK